MTVGQGAPFDHRAPENADSDDRTILNFEDEQILNKMWKGPLSPEDTEKMRKIYQKIQRNPRRDDIKKILCFFQEKVSYQDDYTRGVHAELVKLIGPLKALIHDVDDANKDELLAPVRAIGEELSRKGGITTMRAVYYPVTALLADEQAFCADGEPWSDAKTTLNLAWEGVGIWRA
tara:strand:+ start:5927 stop:6454 length:528 start_codon:yes stop_codon:yes gene_type:complete